MNEFFSSLFLSDYGGTIGGPETAVLVILLSFTIGHLIGWIYMWTHQSLSYSHTFVASLVVIPVLVAVMMMLMTGGLIVAFGLLAVFAVVRFRNVLKDTRDTSFILWAITQGLAVGTLKYSTAVIAAVCISFVLLYLRTTSFGTRHRFDAVLNLRLTGDLVVGVAQLNQILDRHCLKIQEAEDRRVTDEGVDLAYRVLLRDPARSDQLDWDLRQTEGMEDVSVFVRREESEF
jgi:hypothetical protein